MNRILFACLVLSQTLAPSTSASAQTMFPQQGNPEDVFLLAPRSMVRLLREGQRAIEEGRFTDGVVALGSLLGDESEDLPEDLRGQDFFLAPGRLGLYNQTVKGEAIRLLSDLPAAGRKVLEIEYGVAARQGLDKAAAENDWGTVAEVARKYPHTEAGYDALILIARHKLTSGFPLAAANILQGLLQYPAARGRYGAGLALNAAACWIHAGNQEAAIAVLQNASVDFRGASITVDGQQIPLDASTDWKTIVQNAKQFERPHSSSLQVENWLTAGGSPSRNATVESGMPLANARWVKEIHGSMPEKDAIERLAETERQGERVILPKFEVRMLGDLLLTKTTDSEVLAVDFETGITKWSFYHNSTPVKHTNNRLDGSSMGSNAELSTQLRTKVWGSSAFGRFSCDPERLYFVSDEHVQRLSVGGFSRTSDRNMLQAASLAGEGKLLWQVGAGVRDAAATSEPALKDAYFLGPPLAYEGDLFAIIEIHGETRLVVLDPETGKLRWHQQLMQSIFRQLSQDTERRSQAVSPTISDGVVLCPTGAGAVLAVDLLTRSLRWGQTYATENDPAQMRRNLVFGLGASEFEALAPRWHDAGMIAQDGVVVISPPEANLFFCRNILTGAPVLDPQKRDGARYIAGIRDGKIIIVAERQVYAWDILERNYAWELEFPDRLLLAGKGLWLTDSLIVPLTDNRLLQVDTSSGSLMGVASVDQPLGNLFAHQGNLISVSPTSVAVYYAQDNLRSTVDQRLAQDSQDVWALNQKSQLAMFDGQLDQAYELLTSSLKIDPSNVDTRYLLTETLLEGLSKDFSKYSLLAPQVEDVVEYGPQRFRFFQWLALGNIRANQHLAAFERLFDLMRFRLSPLDAGSQSNSQELRLSEHYSLDTDTWIAIAMARLYQLASPQDRQQMDVRVQHEMAAVEGVIMPMRRQQLKYFAWHASAAQYVLEAARYSLDNQDQTSGEQLLLPLLYSEDSAIRKDAEQLLTKATVLERLMFGPRGRAFSSVYDNMQAVEGLESMVTQDRDIPDQLMVPIPWKAGKMESKLAKDTVLFPTGVRVEQTSERFGRPEIDIRLSGGWVVISNSNGEDIKHLEYNRASADSNDWAHGATVRGGLVILETSSEVIGMDLYRGLNDSRDALLWRQSLAYPSAGPSERFSPPTTNRINTSLGVQIQRRLANKQQTAVGPLTPAGLVLQLGTKIVLIDAYSGRQLWSRDGYDENVRLAAEGLTLAIVNPSMGRVELVDCRDGAQVGDSKYQGEWRKWFSYEGFMVDYTEVQSRQTDGILNSRTMRPILRIWNPISGEEFAKLDLQRGSRAAVCEGRYLTVLDPNSTLHFFDLKHFRHVQHPVAVEAKLQNILLERFDDTLVVLCNAELGEQTTNIPNLEQTSRDFGTVNGNIYAINLVDGSLRWTKPGNLKAMFLPKSQPRNSPFMLAYRINSSNTQRSMAATVALVDLRTGRLAYSTPEMEIKNQSGFAMQLRPRVQKVEVLLGGINFAFTATDDDQPPQPVFSFGQLQPWTGGKGPLRGDLLPQR